MKRNGNRLVVRLHIAISGLRVVIKFVNNNNKKKVLVLMSICKVDL